MENLIIKCIKTNRPVTQDVEAAHYHSGYEFIFVEKGNVQFLIDEQCYEEKAPFVLLLNPFEQHKILSVDGEYERTILVIAAEALEQQISPHLIARFKCRPVGYSPILLPKPETFSKLQNLLAELRKERKKAQPYYETYVLNLLYNLLILLFREVPEAPKTDERMLAIQSYIDEHYGEIEGIGALSKHFYLSLGHLSRAFKLSTGYTPMEYLLNTRLFKAQALLLDSTLRVNEISRRVGFLDANQFNRQFKKKFAVTPLNFRKQHIEKSRP